MNIQVTKYISEMPLKLLAVKHHQRPNEEKNQGMR